ncbi:hypothetical protein CVIRNUC_008723 [Coccomyxa viridis]|uniref:Uncharacterized protein n=1 Tax=Coccomyxa viridis TaxID=1274662 RepID=A0AAV1IE10_9CHLO|nr:hypothetical protein CVIRNUC_008723 [Coccomyxa viridis]
MALPRDSQMSRKGSVKKEQSIKALLQKLAEAKDENELLSQALQDLQAEQTKYEARIVGLQRAKLEAAAKADAQWQRAEALQQELDKLAGEKTRWQSQERAQALKMRKMQNTQAEMEDALIELKGEADESAQAAEQAQVEAAELLDRLRGRDGDVASVEASRDEALRRARVTQDELHDSQSRQSEAFREEREGLMERVRFLEEQFEASQASAAAAAEQMPVGCGEQCQRKTLEIERLQLELHALLERFQEQRAALAEAQQQVQDQQQAAAQLRRQSKIEQHAATSAAAIFQEGSRQARQHSEQAMQWVHRLRGEVLEMEGTLERAHCGRLELVREKLRLAAALSAATGMLAAARALEARPAAGDGEQEGAAGVEAGSMPEAEDVRWQLSEAVAAERAMLHRLECEIRRVLELERLRMADLRDNQEIHARLEAEVHLSQALREDLAEHKMTLQA